MPRICPISASAPARSRSGFNDSAWRAVNLPHDWGIELPFDRTGDKDHGYRPLGRNFPSNSIGWYLRTFELPKSDSGKRIWLTFDGVFRDTTVWVNGWLVRRHEGGYNPFREDITDIVRFGGRNTVAVRVDATKFEGWFYEGAGIYRHVWLDKTAPLAIAPDGIFVYSKFKNNVPSDKAEILVEANLLNAFTNATTAIVICQIVSPDGKLLAQCKESVKVDGESRAAVKLNRTSLCRFFGRRNRQNSTSLSPPFLSAVKPLTNKKLHSASALWALTRRTAFF